MKVLLVEDSESMRLQVFQCLNALGHEVIEAEDGIDGLAKLESTTGIDLVLCDVNMPGMGGLAFVDEAKKRGSEIPIIMLTTRSELSNIRKARDAGAKAWIIKPFRSDLLVIALNKVAHGKSSTMLLAL